MKTCCPQRFKLLKLPPKKHIIITGGGTGIPNSATHGALAVNGISIAYSNEGHCEGGHEPATSRGD